MSLADIEQNRRRPNVINIGQNRLRVQQGGDDAKGICLLATTLTID